MKMRLCSILLCVASLSFAGQTKTYKYGSTTIIAMQDRENFMPNKIFHGAPVDEITAAVPEGIEAVKSGCDEKQIAKQRTRLMKRFMKALGSFCKKANGRHLWTAKEQMDNLLGDVRSGQIKLDIVSRGVLDDNSIGLAQLEFKDKSEMDVSHATSIS